MYQLRDWQFIIILADCAIIRLQVVSRYLSKLARIIGIQLIFVIGQRCYQLQIIICRLLIDLRNDQTLRIYNTAGIRKQRVSLKIIQRINQYVYSPNGIYQHNTKLDEHILIIFVTHLIVNLEYRFVSRDAPLIKRKFIE